MKKNDMLGFPVLAALARKPMSAREVSRNLLMSRSQVYVRLKELEQQNLIIQRARDLKWVPVVSIKYEKPEEGARNLPENAPERPHESRSEDFGRKPEAAPPDPKPEPYKPSIPVSASPNAARIAKHFRVPAVITGKEASMGKLERCDQCEKPTPLKYGNVPICPICARDDQR